MRALFIVLGLISAACNAPVTTTAFPERLGGRYANFNPGKKLGSGIYARVIKMTNPLDNTEIVAAKCPRILLSGGNKKYFKREKKTYQLINENGGHPNVVQMLAFQDRSGPRRFFIKLYDSSLMDKHLEKIIRFRDNLPFDVITTYTLCKILIQLMDGLRFVHNINIFHRDIHMGNIMISKDDKHQIVLIDFGSSKPPKSDKNAKQMAKYDVKNAYEAALRYASRLPHHLITEAIERSNYTPKQNTCCELR